MRWRTRGYSFMLFFVALTLLALVARSRTDQLRWWLLFARERSVVSAEFPRSAVCRAYGEPGVRSRTATAAEWAVTRRLAAFNALAAVPVLQWVLPSVPQIRGTAQGTPEYVTDVWQWLHDLAAVLAFGWQYDNPLREAHVGTDWKGVAANFPVPSLGIGHHSLRRFSSRE